jgi:hypothetical protein
VGAGPLTAQAAKLDRDQYDAHSFAQGWFFSHLDLSKLQALT